MNLGVLKLEFKQYLEDNNLLDKKDIKGNANDISIFSYANEFKDFIASEYKTDDSFSSKSITEIMSMEITADGEIVDTKGTESNKETQETDKNLNSQENSETTNDIFNDIFNELIKTDEFFDKLDNDGDNNISQDEFRQFMDTIKNLDDNEEDISVMDILSAADYIKNNEFDKLINPTHDEDNQKIPETETDKDIPSENSQNIGTNNSSFGTNYTGSSNYAGGTSSISNSNPVSENKSSEKSINNMSKEELQEEAKTTEQDIKDKKKNLNNLYNGENPQLTEIQNNIDSSFDEYTSALEKENSTLAEEVRNNESKIRDKESEISTKEEEITNQELTVSDAENQYNNAVETVNALQATLDKLLSTDNTNYTSEKQQDLSTKITNARSELEKAKKAEKKAEKKVDDENEKLDNLKKELKKLKEEDLEALNQEKKTLEEKIAEKYSSIKELMDNYNKNKEEYKVQKDTLIQQASQELLSAQTHLNEVNTALNNKNNKETTSKLSMYELFKDDIEYNIEYIDNGETMPYVIIGPKDAELGGDLPAVLYLHGKGQVGGNGDSIINGISPANFMPDWDLKDFNGYIICPVLTGNYNAGTWQNQKAVEYVDQLLGSLTTKYNIDKEKIALTGASLGGTGALYIGKYLSHRFCAVASMSGYNCYDAEVNPNNFDIPVYGYSGTPEMGEDRKSYNYMKSAFGDKLNVYNCSHDQLPEAVYSKDSDGDGCSDLLELLFEIFNY